MSGKSIQTSVRFRSVIESCKGNVYMRKLSYEGCPFSKQMLKVDILSELFYAGSCILYLLSKHQLPLS